MLAITSGYTDDVVKMPLRASLPSSSALFMFEAAARHRNFTVAAREFNVTQPAISRMISRLEKHLGVALFVRKSTGLELTQDGRLLQRAVREGFERIEDTIFEIRNTRHQGEVVTLSISSAFAIHWLMPRFHKIRQDLPNVVVRLELIHGDPLGRLGAADIGLRYGVPESEETVAWPLVEGVVIPVCSPEYLRSHGPIDGPNGLSGQVLANLSGNMRIPWSRFLATTEADLMREATELSFPDYALLIQGAIKGQAVALGWWHVVAGEIFSAGLVPAGHTFLRTGTLFQLVARRSAAQRPAVQQVRQWLQAEFNALEARRAELDLVAAGSAAADAVAG